MFFGGAPFIGYFGWLIVGSRYRRICNSPIEVLHSAYLVEVKMRPFMKKGDYVAVEEAYRRMIMLRPEDPAGYLFLAILLDSCTNKQHMAIGHLAKAGLNNFFLARFWDSVP